MAKSESSLEWSYETTCTPVFCDVFVDSGWVSIASHHIQQTKHTNNTFTSGNAFCLSGWLSLRCGLAQFKFNILQFWSETETHNLSFPFCTINRLRHHCMLVEYQHQATRSNLGYRTASLRARAGWKNIVAWDVCYLTIVGWIQTHKIHVWYIYLQLVDFYGKWW